MKTLILPAVLLTHILFAAGCNSWSDYPSNEPCLTNTDLHKSGPGVYGGQSTPQSPVTQKSEAGKI